MVETQAVETQPEAISCCMDIRWLEIRGDKSPAQYMEVGWKPTRPASPKRLSRTEAGLQPAPNHSFSINSTPSGALPSTFTL